MWAYMTWQKVSGTSRIPRTKMCAAMLREAKRKVLQTAGGNMSYVGGFSMPSDPPH
jgi:hypothetical protein